MKSRSESVVSETLYLETLVSDNLQEIPFDPVLSQTHYV